MSGEPFLEGHSRPLLASSAAADRNSPTTLSEKIRTYRDVVADWFRRRTKASKPPTSPKRTGSGQQLGYENCE